MATENRILPVEFEGEHRVKAHSLWQWDYGQLLVFKDLDLPNVYEVHFSNNPLGTSKTVVGTDAGAKIPDEYLEKPASIYAWVYLHDGTEDGETEYMCEIPVLRRAKPDNINVTGDDQRTFTQMMAALEAELTNAEDKAKAYARQITDTKVDKVTGKGLSTEDFTTELKEKLEGIDGAAGRQVNADWNATSGPAQILNKPTNLVSDPAYVHTDANFTVAEKSKLRNIAEGATKTTVDTSISGTSTNPVQNRIVKAELDKKVNKADVDDMISFTSSNPVQNRTLASALNQKVDKATGKGLSTNDFTDGLKTKLEGIEPNATRTVVDASITASSTNPVQSRAIKEALDKKIDIAAAKQMTEENFTAEMRAKLEGIEAGAQKNVQSDWNAETGESFIRNKPVGLVQDDQYVHTDANFTRSLKNKLEGIEEKANRTIVDAALSYTSTNPIQNKAIADVLKRYGIGLSFKHDGGSYSIYLMGADGRQLGGAIPIGSAAEVMVYDVDEILTEFGEKPVIGRAIFAALKELKYDLEFDEEDFSIHLVNPEGVRVGTGAIIGDSKIAYKHAVIQGYEGTDEEYYNLIYATTQDYEEAMRYHDSYIIGRTLYLNRGRIAGTTLFI